MRFKPWSIEKVTGYEPAIQVKMQRLFAVMSEKDRRRYAGIEAPKLGHGGTEYISTLFGFDPETVRCVIVELDLNRVVEFMCL